MPDYDFSGLTPRSFEHMTQALSIGVLGGGVVVFGDGPDGGREATFSGRLAGFPAKDSCWDGYLVVQAKFCQRPKRNPREDTKWVLEELRKELDAFSKSGKKRRRPQYYILVTNVVLSPASRSGGKDRVSTLLDEHKRTLGIKDYRIWDYDQLCRYLDRDGEVRRSYEAWTTPGDVLAALAAKLEESSPDFTKVTANFLQKETLDDHYSKLEQAGHGPGNRVPLEEVFVDLPAFAERLSTPPDEQVPLPPGMLSGLLSVGSLCLRPKEVDPLDRISRIAAIERGEPGRYVLVGGPGQGKSTLAQFLCQIHRASLLSGRKKIDQDVKGAVKSILRQCDSQELPWRVARRFPVRLELARFAKALATQAETGVNSVLSYVCFLIKDRTNCQMTCEDLRLWLETYPWLIVLDGLDEVPASSNRAHVLQAIRDFLVDAATSDADVLVLGTTRPQGYNQEFSPERYVHRWLAPLSVARALHYGETLVTKTYQNEQRKNEIWHRLRNAAGMRETARLMESPLQVTIMARLLSQVAQPPQDRYKLFQQYYKVIYRREMERGVQKLSQLLRDHEANIDAIHHRTGLLLQMESERTRYTDATISVEQLRAVVTDRLREEGYTDSALRDLADLIVTCATDRLVFLVPSQSERVGFEIRSLQEFMAAEALMDGPDRIVRDRLRCIASVPFWQNVLLFAAGKCFAERQWLRDTISQVCAELNDDPDDSLAHVTMAGSRVALALLEDGPARRQPAYGQALARQAMVLLDLPPDEVHVRLGDVYEPALDQVYREDIENRLRSARSEDTLSAWAVLCRLMQGDRAPWAAETGESYWPRAATAAAQLLETSPLDVMDHRWLLRKLSELLFELPLSGVLLRRHSEYRELTKMNEPVALALKLVSRGVLSDRAVFSVGQMEHARIGIMQIRPAAEVLPALEPFEKMHAHWRAFAEGCVFARKPSSAQLSLALRSVAAAFDATEAPLDLIHAMVLPVLPWPLSACLASAATSKDLVALAERAESGRMGTRVDWLKAERRWARRGISKTDLDHMSGEHWPIPSDIATVGVPLACAGLVLEESENLAAELAGLYKELAREPAKCWFASRAFYWLLHLCMRPSQSRPSDAPMAALLVDLAMKTKRLAWLPLESIQFLSSYLREGTSGRLVWNSLGEAGLTTYRRDPSDLSAPEQLIEDFCNWVENDPSLTGILQLLSNIASCVRIHRLPSLDWSRYENLSPPVAIAALTLQAAAPDLKADEFPAILGKLVHLCDETGGAIHQALRTLESQHGGQGLGQFLEKALDMLPRALTGARARVQSMLLTDLASRRARLSERLVWDQLKLPMGLLDLLT